VSSIIVGNYFVPFRPHWS